MQRPRVVLVACLVAVCAPATLARETPDDVTLMTLQQLAWLIDEQMAQTWRAERLAPNAAYFDRQRFLNGSGAAQARILLEDWSSRAGRLAPFRCHDDVSLP